MINLFAFAIFGYELFWSKSNYGLLVVPDLARGLKKTGLKKNTTRMCAILFTIAFAPALVLWYFCLVVFAGILLLELIFTKEKNV